MRYADPRAIHFSAGDHGNPTDCWHVQAGDYADEPDLDIVIEHAVSIEGVDCRAAVAAEIVRALSAALDGAA